MKDIIYRQAAIRLVHSVLYEMMVDAASTDIEKPMSKEDKLLVKVNQIVCTKLRKMPSAEPRMKGRWVQISPAKIYECSECGQNVMTDDIGAYRWCCGCGAMMSEGEDDALNRC